MWKQADGRLYMAGSRPQLFDKLSWYRWSGSKGSYTNDWAVRIDATILDAFTTGTQWGWGEVSIRITSEGGSASCHRLSTNLYLFHDDELASEPQRFVHVFASSSKGGININREYGDATVTLRVYWRAETEEFLIQYDSDGIIGGWNWTTVASINVGAAGEAWGLDETAAFDIRITNQNSGYAAIPAGTVWVDNFNAASAPKILVQPSDVTGSEGNGTALSVSVDPLSGNVFVWKRNGIVLPNAHLPTLNLPILSQEDAGEYSVTISNEVGAVTSAVATLTVTPVVGLPSFVQQPKDVASWVGQTVSFSIDVNSTTPLSYQWQRDAVDLPGATGSSLSLPNISVTHAGDFRVRVANANGARYSDSAKLLVATAPPPRLGRTIFAENVMIIHWPISATGFSLWDSVSPTGPWTQAPSSVFLFEGSKFGYQVDQSQGSHFFHLRK